MSSHADPTELFNEPSYGRNRGDAFRNEAPTVSHQTQMAAARQRSNLRYRYDITEQMRANPFAVSVTITKEDKLDSGTANLTLDRLHERFGVSHWSQEKLWAFDNALWFCHTLNGASTYSEGRASFSLCDREFLYSEVINHLGTDLRRFFRAFADDIRDVNYAVWMNNDIQDPDAQTRREDLLRVARQRGMIKHPEYCHDSADACSSLPTGVANAIAESKAAILAKAHAVTREPKARLFLGPVESD